MCYTIVEIYEKAGSDMSFSLIPRLMADSLTDLTPQLLQTHGIQFLMLDFDNTIVPYTTNVPTPEMERWLREMQASSIGALPDLSGL